MANDQVARLMPIPVIQNDGSYVDVPAHYFNSLQQEFTNIERRPSTESDIMAAIHHQQIQLNRAIRNHLRRAMNKRVKHEVDS